MISGISMHESCPFGNAKKREIRSKSLVNKTNIPIS